MRKVFVLAAVAAMIMSACGSKGNQSAEMIAEGESDSLYMVNDSTLADFQTFTYEGVLPGDDAAGVDYQLTLYNVGQNAQGTYKSSATPKSSKKAQAQAVVDSGTVVTIIGIPNDSTAIIYQLVSIAPDKKKTNFLAEGDSALTIVGKDFKKAASKINQTLKKGF